MVPGQTYMSKITPLAAVLIRHSWCDDPRREPNLRRDSDHLLLQVHVASERSRMDPLYVMSAAQASGLKRSVIRDKPAFRMP